MPPDVLFIVVLTVTVIGIAASQFAWRAFARRSHAGRAPVADDYAVAPNPHRCDVTCPVCGKSHSIFRDSFAYCWHWGTPFAHQGGTRLEPPVDLPSAPLAVVIEGD